MRRPSRLPVSQRLVHFTTLALLTSMPVTIRAEVVEGIVLPSKQVELSVPLPGILKSLPVEEGDRVKAEEAVAFMDDGLQQVATKASELQANSVSAIKNAELVLEEARISLDRIKEASRSNAASEWEVRRTQLQMDQAAAELEQAKEAREVAVAQWELEREKLKRYAVLAPFTGRVLRIEAEAGASLTQQDKLMSLVALNPLEAHFHPTSEHYGKLTVGQTCTLRLDAEGAKTLPGKVKTIDPVIDPASRTFRVVVEIDNADESMPSGFPVWLDPEATAHAEASPEPAAPSARE